MPRLYVILAQSHVMSQVSQGVSPARLQPRSFGEEQPVALGSSEADWSMNRRVELVVER